MGTRHKYIAETGRYIYHIAIIDYLQDYNLEKKAENWIKVWVYQRKEELMSAVNADMYMKRFYKFMKENVIINQMKKDEGSFIGGSISTSLVKN